MSASSLLYKIRDILRFSKIFLLLLTKPDSYYVYINYIGGVQPYEAGRRIIKRDGDF